MKCNVKNCIWDQIRSQLGNDLLDRLDDELYDYLLIRIFTSYTLPVRNQWLFDIQKYKLF